jgi:hypothetical protein
VTHGSDTIFLLAAEIVKHPNHAEAALDGDRLQDSGDHKLAEICFDGRTPALWDG